MCNRVLVCAHETATLNPKIFGVSFVVVCVSTYAVLLPEGRRNFLILDYIGKAGNFESESWKSLRGG